MHEQKTHAIKQRMHMCYDITKPGSLHFLVSTISRIGSNAFQGTFVKVMLIASISFASGFVQEVIGLTASVCTITLLKFWFILDRQSFFCMQQYNWAQFLALQAHLYL